MKKILLALSVAASFAGIPSCSFAAPAVDPQTRIAARALLESMDIRQAVLEAVRGMEKTWPHELRQQMAAALEGQSRLSAERKKECIAMVDSMLPDLIRSLSAMGRDPALIDDIIDELVPLYTSMFTAAEINELAAFHRSPLGRKVAALTAKVEAESVMISERVMASRMEKLAEDFMQAVQKKLQKQ